MNSTTYPDVLDPVLVGSYSPVAKAGGGYVWDDVLEYRVWCHPEQGAADIAEGGDYPEASGTYAEALAFAENTLGAEEPLALAKHGEQRFYVMAEADCFAATPFAGGCGQPHRQMCI